MAANNPPVTRDQDDAVPDDRTRSLIFSLAEKVTGNDYPFEQPPPPVKPSRWQRSRDHDEEDPPPLYSDSSLIRLCNSFLSLAIEENVPRIIFRRTAGVLRIEFQGGAVEEISLPGHLFEKIAARYLIMASSTNSEDGPFFNSIRIAAHRRKYTVTVSLL